MIQYIQGDLLKGSHPYIAHGVNCQGVMNSGVAKAIRNKWSIVYNEYMNFYDEYESRDLLGKINVVKVNDYCTVFNCFTQLTYGYDNKKYISYDAIDLCFKQILLEINKYPITELTYLAT